jgi:GNAT superfamily N-acetyltransferase
VTRRRPPKPTGVLSVTNPKTREKFRVTYFMPQGGYSTLWHVNIAPADARYGIRLGSVNLTVRWTGWLLIDSRIEPDVRGTGVGAAIYIAAACAAGELGFPGIESYARPGTRSEHADRLWERLHRHGLAVTEEVTDRSGLNVYRYDRVYAETAWATGLVERAPKLR